MIPNISKIFLGETEISKVYSGNVLVYENTPTPPSPFPSGYTPLKAIISGRSHSFEMLNTETGKGDGYFQFKFKVKLHQEQSNTCLFGVMEWDGTFGYNRIGNVCTTGSNGGKIEICDQAYNSNISFNPDFDEYVFTVNPNQLTYSFTGYTNNISSPIESKYNGQSPKNRPYWIFAECYGVGETVVRRSSWVEVEYIEYANTITGKNAKLLPCLDDTNKPCLYDVINKIRYIPHDPYATFGYITMDNVMVQPAPL